MISDAAAIQMMSPGQNPLIEALGYSIVRIIPRVGNPKRPVYLRDAFDGQLVEHRRDNAITEEDNASLAAEADASLGLPANASVVIAHALSMQVPVDCPTTSVTDFYICTNSGLDTLLPHGRIGIKIKGKPPKYSDWLFTLIEGFEFICSALEATPICMTGMQGILLLQAMHRANLYLSEEQIRERIGDKPDKTTGAVYDDYARRHAMAEALLKRVGFVTPEMQARKIDAMWDNQFGL